MDFVLPKSKQHGKCMVIIKYILFLIFESISVIPRSSNIHFLSPPHIYDCWQTTEIRFSYVNMKSRWEAQHRPAYQTYCNTTNNYLVYSYMVHPNKNERCSSFVVFYSAFVPIVIYPYLFRQLHFTGAIVRLRHYQRCVHGERVNNWMAVS